jgi:nickel-dependent lactate racemase
VNIILVSSLSVEQVQSMFLTPAPSMQEAIIKALNEQGENAKLLFMPEASRLAVKITGQE